LTHIRDVAATKKIQSQTPAHLHTLKRGVSNCEYLSFQTSAGKFARKRRHSASPFAAAGSI
jgi:hypothetical protein